MRIPFYWNTITMANSLLLESSPYLSGASYASNDDKKKKKIKHASLSLSLTNEVEPENASNRTLHPPSLTNPREKNYAIRNTVEKYHAKPHFFPPAIAITRLCMLSRGGRWAPAPLSTGKRMN